jgi:hypothetical protein
MIFGPAGRRAKTCFQVRRRATLEILSSQELMAQIQTAERALKSGAKTEFISWEKVRYSFSKPFPL